MADEAADAPQATAAMEEAIRCDWSWAVTCTDAKIIVLRLREFLFDIALLSNQGWSLPSYPTNIILHTKVLWPISVLCRSLYQPWALRYNEKFVNE